MSRRSKLDITLDLLDIIKRGTDGPTRIMYSANISWGPLQKFLRLLQKQGLIIEKDAQVQEGSSRRKPDGRKRYRYMITKKGENILNHIHRMEKEMGVSYSVLSGTRSQRFKQF